MLASMQDKYRKSLQAMSQRVKQQPEDQAGTSGKHKHKLQRDILNHHRDNKLQVCLQSQTWAIYLAKEQDQPLFVA